LFIINLRRQHELGTAYLPMHISDDTDT